MDQMEMLALIETLKQRFLSQMERHPDLNWQEIEQRLLANPDKLQILKRMEETGGEPDCLEYDPKTNHYYFYDCAKETPLGRRGVCYDENARNSRKNNIPWTSAEKMAKEIGIEILDETQYRKLQSVGQFDTKTSSWLKTPDAIRKLGGAIFGDYRYGQVFIYHNGAESYYSVRGFRGVVEV